MKKKNSSIPNSILPFSLDPVGLYPHKIFLWDKHGTYIDYSYPNPQSSHFIGGSNILGQTVKEMFPKPTSTIIMSYIKLSLAHKVTSMGLIELPFHENTQLVLIRFLPFHQHVLGLVNDWTRLPTGSSIHHSNQMANLTSKELEVILWVGEGKSNWEIGKILGLTERTVKFHLEKVFRKLNVSSRSQLGHFLPSAKKSIH